MKREATVNDINENKRKSTPIVFYFVLLLLYFVCNIAIGRVAKIDGVLRLGDKIFPISSFTGILSALLNFATIFLVVFFNRLGFITVIVIVAAQLPMIVRQVMIQEVVTSLPGLFTNMFIIVAAIIIYRRNRMIDKYQTTEVEHLKEQQLLSKRLFEQTATALVNSIDAKDTYSRGHSVRVAEYSEKIARVAGKSDEECEMIFYSALLHDVGKIGISDAIINKNGKLTSDEYDVIKEHPVMGNQILSSIEEYPYLSVGAHYHHERYDGKGYPDGLKGEEIPEIARIISVADAYDAMTSNRSYRSAIPQQIVREEIVKGAGTQFDPEFAIIM
ncbi:MAG: HD-GYP domain-containing protein, partial [Lachnospiraceae bacterium]|nr:HD-GYP domain-containing protein [Lachnospiraceae bacterium]